MYVSKIIVRNFRILEDVSFELENDLSLIIGKNNTGKTSLLKVLSRFFDCNKTNKFRFDDFSLNAQTKLLKTVIEDIDLPISIDVLLIIAFDEKDDLSTIDFLIDNLDVDNKNAVLKVTYAITEEKLEKLKSAFKEYNNSDDKFVKGLKPIERLHRFMNAKLDKYFSIEYYQVPYSVISNIDDEILKQKKLSRKEFIKKNFIAFKSIKARRKNDNKYKDDSLSSLSQRYFNLIKDNEKIVKTFEDMIVDSDNNFTNMYKNMFEGILSYIKKFGGLNKAESSLRIISELRSDKLLNDNTRVVYELGNDVVLPESYNGLGYLNLINIVLHLYLIIEEFKHDFEDKKPSVLNLLFIEEPEAHMHPQLQVIFIKNINAVIKELTESSSKLINVQIIISTHSAHLISQCVFDSIKYMRRTNDSVVTLSLKNVDFEYKNEKDHDRRRFKFLKKYLTLDWAEIFFADKIILYEGDTERILLPSMMRAIDENFKNNPEYIPMSSQNISMIPAGAYAYVFDRFLQFIGKKVLIITDIDSVKEDKNACKVNDGCMTSNCTLRYYFGQGIAENELLRKLKEIAESHKAFDGQGKYSLLVAYQTEETCGGIKYYPRSFEDAFIFINPDCFDSVNDNKMGQPDWAYTLAEKLKKKKTTFALDILLKNNFATINAPEGWKIPPYIEEGLKWLAE